MVKGKTSAAIGKEKKKKKPMFLQGSGGTSDA